MKIAIWIEQDSSGGVDTHLVTLLKNWPKDSSHICIFTNSDNPSIMSYESIPSQNITFVVPMKRLVLAKKYKLLVETLFLPLFLIISFFKSRRLLRRFGEFDVFIADQGGYPGSWSTNIALKASHSLGIKKRVLLVHHQAVPRRIFMNTIESIFDRRVAFWSTSIITVSNATRDSLVNRRDFNLMRKPITVIYNGLDEKSELVKNRFRALFGISLDRRVALVLGRGEVYKGHEELLRSIALLPIEIKKDFLLVIVGKVDAARREYLTDLAKRLGVLELIMFCGFVDLDSSEIIVDVDLLVCVTQDFEGLAIRFWRPCQ